MKNIEKYVKSNLKKKITVNRALIILFMITGSFNSISSGANKVIGKDSYSRGGFVIGNESLVGDKELTKEDIEKIKELEKAKKDLEAKEADLRKKMDKENDTNEKIKILEEIKKIIDERGKKEKELLDFHKNESNDSYTVGANTITLGDYSFTIGDNSYTKGDKTYSLGLDNKVYGDSNQVHGNNNKVGTEEKTIKDNLVFGNDNEVYSKTQASSGTEHGSGKVVPQAQKVRANEIYGNNNKVYGDGNISFGSNNTIGTKETDVKNNIVLGSKITIDGINNAIVFGDKSTAVKDAVSFGNDKKQRKLKFVAKGTDKTDAVNVEQLDDYAKKEELSKYLKSEDVDVKGDNTYIQVDNNQKGKKNNYKISLKTDEIKKYITSSVNLSSKADKNAENITVNEWAKKLGTGEVKDGDTNLVTGGKVYTELNKKLSDITVTGDTYITATKDTNDKSKYTLTFNKDELVKNLDLSKNTALNTKANVNADNITVNEWAKKLGTGKVENGNTNLVTGGTVYTELNKKLSDITVTGDTYITATKDTNDKSKYTLTFNKDELAKNLDLSKNTALNTKANINADNITVNEWAKKLGTGKVENGNTNLVTGGTVYTELNKKLSDITVTGDTYITATKDTNDKSKYTLTFNKDELAKNLDLSKNTALNTKANINADNITVNEWAKKLGTGKVENGNTNLVTGGTVYTELNKKLSDITVTGDTYITATKDENDKSKYTLTFNKDELAKNLDLSKNTALNTKANVNADNITVNEWAKKLGTGKVENGNTNLVTGGTVYTELNKKANIDASNLKEQNIKDWQAKLGTGSVADNNTGLVNGGTVKTYVDGKITNSTNTINTKLDTKLDKDDLDVTGDDKYITVTNEDKTKKKYKVTFNEANLKNLVNNTDITNNTYLKAKLDDKADKNASNLTETDITAWQAKLGNGNVASGDTKLVKGDTVFTYVNNTVNTIKQELSTKTTEDLAKKLDVDAKNITDDGVATLTTKLGTGVIEDNNKNLVTGGTVKKYITEEINNINTKVSGKLSSDDVDVKGDEYITVNKDVQKPNHYSLVFDKDKLATDLDLSKNTKLTEQFNKYALLDGSNLTSDEFNLNVWQAKLGNGEVKEGNTGLVKGGDIFTYVNNIKQELNNQATQDLSNKLDKDGSNLDKTSLDKLTNKLSEGSNLTTPTNRLVTDTTVSEALKGKLNVAADNLTTKGETNLINKLSKGSDISKPNNRLVTDTQVNEHLKNNYYNKAEVDAKVSNISNTVVEANKKSELALGGVANAVAMANLVQVNSYSKHRHNLSAAYGYYGGAHALAVGFSGTNEERNFVYKLSGSVNNKGNLALGVGAGVMLGEENDYIESTEVKKLKETVKEQRDKISNLEKKLDEVLKLIKK
ncbi:YadA-like family protein [Sneathia vaginalis]|uniref:YadA-like family protein n=1 Tax=Sneathia vaginalis TaxID=187101 RepID=UPI0035C71CAD